MEQETKKINRKLKRLIIGSLLSLVSLIIGVVSGMKIAKLTNVEHNQTKFDQLIDVLKESWRSDIYYENENEDTLINQFIGALSTSDEVMLDPYTYLKKKEPVKEVPETGKLGVTLSYIFNYPVITEVDKEGSSYNILQVGDIVTSLGKKVDGEYKFYSIIDEGTDYSNIFDQALGPVEDKVMVNVARFNENNVLTHHSFEITLTKEISTEYVYEVEDNIDDTLMVKMTGFVDSSNGTAPQFEQILKNDNSKNLIIDLRDNGGGDVASVIDICDLFLPKDILVATLEYKNSIRECRTFDDKLYEYEKIFVLQNKNTASASEILISTLLYYFDDKVTLIGTNTYGKGIAQKSVSVLDNKYILQYTCAKWLRPDNSWIGMTINDKEAANCFKPSTNCEILKGDILTIMEKNNGYVYYKENNSNYLAFKEDKVAYQNQYFFEIYNALFNKNIRTDRYFDSSCIDAIKEYQNNKGLDANGNMNQDTFLHFVKDFYDAKSEYSKKHLNKVSEIIGD